MAHSITSGKRARDDEDSDENMLSDGSSTALSSSAPTEEPEQPTKRLQLDVDKDGSSPESSQVVRCSLPPHEGLSFPTFDAFEVHYEQHHLHRCSECHKNFPSDHYLQLHIAENHDPITAVKMERGERTVRTAQGASLARPSAHHSSDLSLPASLRTVIGGAHRHRNVAGT